MRRVVLLITLLALALPARALAAAPPTSTQAPVAAGNLVRGSVVSATSGAWANAPTTYVYAWQRDSGSGFATIPGATAAAYTLTGADVNTSVRALVTARNAGGASAPAPSNALGPIAAAPPVNAIAPSVTGTAARGSVLQANAGTWAGVTNVFTYQWQRDSGAGFANIAGATLAAYTLAVADEGAQVRVMVRAVNVDGSVLIASGDVGPVAATPPVNSAVPTITGTPTRGLALTTNAGSWSGVGNTYTYQWQRDTGSGFADIAGATSRTYSPVAADTGARLRSTVTASNPDGAVASHSLPVGPVGGSAPVNTAVPAISGTARRTAVLTAAVGTWGGAGNAYAFQWQRDAGGGFQDIPGATTSAYTLATADVGARVRVEVTATNPDGSVVAVSAASAVVATSLPVAGAAPAVSGTAWTGLTLSATTGTWTPAGATFTYQWQRDGGSGFTDIPGATAATYRLTDTDARTKVRAKVTASNPDGSTVGYSPAAGPVLATPSNAVAPTIVGTLTDASPLSADPGAWVSAGNLAHTYKYQWVRCPVSATDANSLGCGVLPGATSVNYTTVAADVGFTLGVRVTATNSDNGSATAISGVTAAVAGRALTNLVQPSITGAAVVRSTLTAGDGLWSVPLTRTAYQWQRCLADGTGCVDIDGATGRAYVAAVEDTNRALVVRVTAFSPGRSASAVSLPTGAIAPQPLPTVVADITISGTPARQNMLRAVMPVWNESPTTFTYQWLRCDTTGAQCVPIAGATTAGYVLAKADEGATIRVRQTGTNTAGTGTTTSAPTGVVVPVVPAASAPPAVSGTAVVGTTVSATRGTWATSPDTTYAYAWARCDAAGAGCTMIAGANASTYFVVAADVGATLRAVVTARNADASVSSTSAPSARVKPQPPAAKPIPVLSGTAAVGQTVTVTTGTWTDATSTTTTFWRCGATCTAIVTGAAHSYTLLNADAGMRIRASVTAVGPGGTTTAYAANVLGPVKSATAANALAAAGEPVSLKSATGKVLAKASARVPKAGGDATVTVTPAEGLKGRYRAWACPGSAALDPCTHPVTLGRRAARLRVAVDAGERVRVVVARSGG
jgi:hypothetical protein